MTNTHTESLGKTTKRFQEMPSDIGDSCIGLRGKLLLDCHNSQAPNCIRHCCTLTQYCIQSGQYQPNFGILSSCIFEIVDVFSSKFWCNINRDNINQTLSFFLLELALFSAKIKCNSNTLLILKISTKH